MKSKFIPLIALLFGSSLFVGAQEDAAAKAEKAARAQAAQAEAAAKFKAGFDRLRFIEGKWLSRKPHATNPDETAWQKTEVAPYMGGKYLEMHGHNPATGVDFQIIFSYYQPGDDYMMSIVDSGSGVLDVYHGTFDADGRLTLTNPQFYRVSLVPSADGTLGKWVGEYSTDKGATWKKGGTFEFKKPE